MKEKKLFYFCLLNYSLRVRLPLLEYGGLLSWCFHWLDLLSSSICSLSSGTEKMVHQHKTTCFFFIFPIFKDNPKLVFFEFFKNASINSLRFTPKYNYQHQVLVPTAN